MFVHGWSQTTKSWENKRNWREREKKQKQIYPISFKIIQFFKIIFFYTCHLTEKEIFLFFLIELN